MVSVGHGESRIVGMDGHDESSQQPRHQVEEGSSFIAQSARAGERYGDTGNLGIAVTPDGRLADGRVLFPSPGVSSTGRVRSCRECE